MTDSEQQTPKDYATVMVHFYRGELGRIMTWRQRLDVTTNWAVVSSTALITFGLSAPQNTHLVFFLANMVTFLLLIIEGRRYRYYDAFRARVRMLEAHFIMPMVLNDNNIIQGDWRKIMAEDLVMPSFKIGRIDAIARRFRRNYFYIFLFILSGWFLKVWLHYPKSHEMKSFFSILLGDGIVPPVVALLALSVFYLMLAYLFIHSFKSDLGYSGEFQKGAMRRKKWIK